MICIEGLRRGNVALIGAAGFKIKRSVQSALAEPLKQRRQ